MQDGRFVVFGSDASNLSALDGSGRNNFIHDTQTDITQLVDIGPNGQAGTNSDFRTIAVSNPNSPQEVAFSSDAFGDGFSLYVRNINSGTTDLIVTNVNRDDYPIDNPFGAHVSHFGYTVDGDLLVSSRSADLDSGDTNNRADIYLIDTNTGAAERLSLAFDGSEPNGDSFYGSFSSDGASLIFTSSATNLIEGGTNSGFNVFERNLQTGEVTLISTSENGDFANGNSVSRGISGDGRFILFESEASNLVPNDSNFSTDVFVYDTLDNKIIRLSETADGISGSGDSILPGFVPGTNIVSFITEASNLLENDNNSADDAVFTDIGSGEFETLDFSGPVQPNDDAFSVGFNSTREFAFLTTQATNLVANDTSPDFSIVRVPTAQILASLSIRGSELTDNLMGTNQSDFILGLAWDDTIRAGRGADLINAGSGNDLLFGEAGGDVLNGESGNDELEGGSGQDDINGGSGVDTATFRTAGSGVVANLTSGIGTQGNANGDTYTSIENLVGSDFGDTLTGSSGNNLILGGRGNDNLRGSAGNDRLEGGIGRDDVNGGSGTDSAAFATAGAGVTLNLTAGTGTRGNATGDTYTSIENVIGSNFDDVITGSSGRNILVGGRGEDTLRGSAGDDLLRGGLGDDILNGGSGNDQFRFDTALDAATNVDTIQNYSVSNDEIELDDRVFDALGSGVSSSEFRIGSSAQDSNDFLIYNSTTGELFYDADGAGGDSQTLFAELDAGLNLTASEFDII